MKSSTRSIIHEIDYQQFDSKIYEDLVRERVPLAGNFELTFHCNMNCLHCYLSATRSQRCPERELSSRQIFALVDELATEGVLFLLITGGEPLCRNDFADIYTYIKNKGILVGLFTNGTLVTRDTAKLLSELPPIAVEISLYGATRGTYESITQVPGSFDRCMKGIRLLLDEGVNLKLKTVIINQNQHELEQMKQLAKSLGVDFRYDALVIPCLSGDTTPYNFRLPPQEAVKYEFDNAPKRAFWRGQLQSEHPPIEYVYVCGAALTTFNIDPYGRLGACLMARLPCYNLLAGSFHEGWYDFLYHEFRLRKAEHQSECSSCKLISICDRCPGWAFIEKKDYDAPIEYLCTLARLRARGLGVIID